MAYFHTLDAWTEYWDIYHPESHGRYYFGEDGRPGLLDLLLPRQTVPPVFQAWKRRAMGVDDLDEFGRCARQPEVAAAAIELDALVGRIFAEHFGCDIDDSVRRDYLTAIHRFAIDALPPATERLQRMQQHAPDDPRCRTAGRHTIDADMMWFVWAMQLEVTHVAQPSGEGADRRALLLAGVATGCPANFAWEGHRRTRAEYCRDDTTTALLAQRGLDWSRSFEDGTAEVHALYRIRERGHAGV